MQVIAGQALAIHPLGRLQKRADLIHFGGPLLSLFENEDGEPYLFLWCDIGEEVNRWLVVRVSPDRLSAYLGRRVTLRTLFASPGDGQLLIADVDSTLSFRQVLAVMPAEVPATYLPAEDSYYEFEPVEGSIDLPSLAARYASPLLDLHLIRGRGVAFGTSDIVTLGAFLQDTGELSENVAISLFADRQSPDALSREEARAYGRLEYVTNKAASFSAILRPVVAQHNLPGFADRTGEVVRTMFQLLTSTRNYGELRQAAAKYDDAVIRSLERLVGELQVRNADMEFRWAVPEDEVPAVVRVDRGVANAILENIRRFDHEDTEGSWSEGTFLALDLKLRSYRFRSEAGRESWGHFDARIAFPLTHVSFERRYRVYMTRRLVQVGGRRRPTVSESIGAIEPLPGAEGERFAL